MSIVLKDGTALPSLSSDVLAECPYVVIVHMGPYFAYFSTKPFAYGSAELLASIGVETDVPCIATFGNGVFYATSGNSDEWDFGGDISSGDMIIPMQEAWEPVWSNHDIEVAESIDLASMTFTTTGEVYFKNCNVFILPDGTEIPAFPDGWSDGTPYGALIFWDLRSDYSKEYMCGLYVSDKPLLSLPDELHPDPSASISPGNPLLCVQPGFAGGFQYIGPDGEWSEAEKGEGTELTPSMPTMMVVWSNHDILNITSLNEDDMSYTIGTEIARKSDVNYRITGGVMRDFANQARRLGASSASLKPAEIEAIFRAVTAAPGDDIGGGTGTVEIVSWSDGTDEQIAAMVAAMDAGTLSIEDTGWAVGDERQVTLAAMEATGVGESHVEQTVTLVLMDSQHYTLTEATVGGDTKDHFVVGLKHSLNEAGVMNSSSTNAGSWSGCERRAWCNNVFRAAIPETIRGIFKQFKVPTATTYGGSTVTETDDYFALFAEKEVVGYRKSSNAAEAEALSQIKWYETAANRIKQRSGSAAGWWWRSPQYNVNASFCVIYSDGTHGGVNANYDYGLSPFGCI